MKILTSSKLLIFGGKQWKRRINNKYKRLALAQGGSK